MAITIEKFDQVHNQTCQFYKLRIGDKCPLDDFVEEVSKNTEDRKSFSALVALMDQYSPTLMLPKKKFRHIESNVRPDIWEFKKNNLRLYIVLKQPNVYLVMGGYKKNQERDIATLNRILREDFS